MGRPIKNPNGNSFFALRLDTDLRKKMEICREFVSSELGCGPADVSNRALLGYVLNTLIEKQGLKKI